MLFQMQIAMNCDWFLLWVHYCPHCSLTAHFFKIEIFSCLPYGCFFFKTGFILFTFFGCLSSLCSYIFVHYLLSSWKQQILSWAAYIAIVLMPFPVNLTLMLISVENSFLISKQFILQVQVKVLSGELNAFANSTFHFESPEVSIYLCGQV